MEGIGASVDKPFQTVKVSSNREPLQGRETVDLPEAHVIEITLEDGIVLYRRAEDLLKEPDTRGAPPDTLPVALTVPTGERSGGRYLVRLYRFFKGEAVVNKAVDRAAERIEQKLVKADTLLRCVTPSQLEDPGQIEEGQEALVLLHGTFSSTDGSFGGLSQSTVGVSAGHWQQLQDHFGSDARGAQNIFAFEHRTLTKSPLRNAIDLVNQVPRGCHLSLLSHSRGGLVGEFLCRAARTGSGGPGSFFDTHDRRIVTELYASLELDETLAGTIAELEELDAKFAEKQIRVGTFARVACPMRGTLLASKRLDLYLSVLLNLLSIVPGPQQAFIEPVSAFVRAVVGSRTDPRKLPGLEAMMPDAPTIALLNRQDISLASHLEIVGGDVEPGGVLRALAIFATDLFFREDHDLVVNTSAMFGGAPRTTEPRALVSRGSSVSHFNYFRDQDGLDRIAGALTGKLEPVAPAERVAMASIARSSRADTAKPAAILLPGIMGSTLSKSDNLIWVDPADLVFGEDHDLVVNTSAMFGGAPRTTEPRALVSRGSSVSHFNYFRDQDGLDRIAGALTGKLEPVAPAERVAMASIARSSRADTAKPAAILLPGIMGSTLSKSDNLIWVDPADLVFGGIRKIGADANGEPAPGVRATGVVERYYMDLARQIARSHQLQVFQYDWRLSVDGAADRLSTVIEQVLDRTEATRQPVRLVCHSMGGLVARRMMAKHRATWERMHENRNGSRIVMLGTPNGGSASMAAGLLGRDKMIRQLELVDVTSNMRQILNALTPLPGLLELLPTDEGFAYFDHDTWKALSGAAPKGWKPPPQDALDSARSIWDGMELRSADIPHMRYIAGQAPTTITAIRPDPFALVATRNGDGRVTWATGLLPGVKTWFAPGVVHGDLARDRRLFEPITDLLLHGSTDQLSQTPPVSRDAEAIFELPEEPVIYPSGAEFELLPMGGAPDPELAERSRAPMARVGIEHGDLRLQSGAVMVGHYRGASLLSAENVLDTLLGGAMRMQRDAGLYPGEIGSSELFLKGSTPTLGPDGALVVGLGPFGELSPQDLRTTLTQAFVRFSLMSPSDTARKRVLTSLIIGHLDSRITVEESVSALLEALDVANRKVPERLRISELKILELYEDRAIEASEALARFAGKERFKTLTIDPRLREGAAGRKRQSYGRDGEWQMIVEVTCPHSSPETLRFRVMNRSALVETDEIEIDRHALDHLIRGVRTDRRFTSDIGRLLFRRLVPRSVRRVLSEGTNVTLVVDRIAASYPWELSQDRAEDKPIAVRTKMIRQLIQNLQPNRPRRPATELALVIGNPPSGYAPLPEALEEAKMVSAKLRSSGLVEVIDAFPDDPEVERHLYLNEPRILHFAGHGIVGSDDDPDLRRRKDALVIGRDTLFSAADIEQMDSVPEFVFLNCCHVGQIPVGEADEDAARPDNRNILRDRTGLAANVAVSYMKQGSKAVIAAGWAIDDIRARIFAETFYDRFLAGCTFAAAVEDAREKTYETSSADPTWGAYQCYGDPQYRLRTLGGSAPLAEETERYSARSQLLAALQLVRADARFVRDQADAQRLFSKIAHVEAEVRAQASWIRDPSVLEALGLGLAEIGERDRAIRYLSEAAQASPPAVSIGSMELLDTLRVRQATDARLRAVDGEDLKEKIEDELREHERAIRALEHHNEHLSQDPLRDDGLKSAGASRGMITRLLRQGDTQLRYAAALASQRGQVKYRAALAAARDAYDAAEEQIGSGQTVELAYSRLRKAAARFFLSAENKESGIDLLQVVDATISSLRANPGSRPVFERELRLAEANLLMLLVEGVFGAQQHEETVNAFMEAFLSGATVGQRQETISDLRALSRLLARQRKGEKAAARVAMISDELRRLALLERESDT
ncbi:MAG: CHAT domain-containing protein [Pseudomonadota bacterium]